MPVLTEIVTHLICRNCHSILVSDENSITKFRHKSSGQVSCTKFNAEPIITIESKYKKGATNQNASKNGKNKNNVEGDKAR